MTATGKVTYVSLAAAHTEIFRGSVLVNAVSARVIDTYDDEGFDLVRSDEFVGCLAHSPVIALDKRCLRIEEILSVLHEENRVTTNRVSIVQGRQVDDEVVPFVDQM